MAVPNRQSFTLAVSTDPQTFEIRHPNRVFITGVLLSQLEGNTDSFTVLLYDKDPADTGAVNPQVHRVMPQIAVTSGVGSYFNVDGVPFVSQASSPARPSDNRMWVVVDGAGAGDLDLTIISRSAEFGT